MLMEENKEYVQENEDVPFTLVLCNRHGPWQLMMDGIPLQYRNFVMRQNSYKNVFILSGSFYCSNSKMLRILIL